MCKVCNRIIMKNFTNPTDKQLRIWWMIQVPSKKPFLYPVKSLEDAKLLLNFLAEYHLMLEAHGNLGDYSDASGLEEYDSGSNSWAEFYDASGRDVWQILTDEEDEE